jgi:hypothetical protein
VLGAFVKFFVVDGETFELYKSTGNEEPGFQLVDEQSLPIGRPFAAVPDELTVTALVRASREVGESAA